MNRPWYQYQIGIIILTMAGYLPYEVSASATSLAAGKGFVVVRIVTNTPTVDPANIITFNKWDKVNLIKIEVNDHKSAVKERVKEYGDGEEDEFDTSENEVEQYQLTLDKSGSRSQSQLFTGQLAEGRYVLHSMVTPTFHKSVAVDLKQHEIEFEVKSNHITNLGTLIYQPTGNNGYLILPLFEDNSVLPSLKSTFPEVTESAAAHPVLSVDKSRAGEIASTSSSAVYIGSFSPIGNLVAGTISSIADASGATESVAAWKKVEDFNTRIEMVKDRSFAFNDIQELDTGEIYVASNMGQILIRQTDGHWKRIDTGYPIEYTAMHIMNNKQMLVGGEEGILLLTTDSGVNWKRIRPPLQNGLFLDISHHDGEYFVLSRRGDDLVVSSARLPALDQWQELLVVSGISESTKYMVRAETGSAVVSENQYILLSPLAKTHVFDIQSREWTTYPLPEQGFIRLRKHHDGYLYAMRFRYPYISRDNGKTWIEHENGCMRLMDLWYGPSAAGYTLCFQGAFTVSNNLQKQKSLEADWEEIISEIPVLTHKIYVSDKRDLLFYVGVNGLVYLSENGGKTWQEERRTF